MAAALRTLADVGNRSGRVTVAVLGEMRELGDSSDDEHAEVGRLAADLGIGLVIGVGWAARRYDGRQFGGSAALQAESVDEAIALVRNNVVGTEIVLIKASRAAGLERVADALLEAGKEAGP
jgi:UDP-N-acetylmuramoyl-tripeptide--D-alanyl-D-alanine ligase